MRRVVELQDVQGVGLKLDNCTLVVVNITIVWSRKNCDHNWELARAVPFVHLVSVELCFMSTQNRQKLIFLKESICGVVAKEIRTSTNVILQKLLR